MPKDARWGLVVGVTVVILVAILFFGRDMSGALAGVPGALPVKPTATVPDPLKQFAIIQAPLPGVPSVPAGRTHKVEDGESLASISTHYYGNADKVSFLFRSNRDRLMAPDRLPIGTLLVIPDAPR